MCESYYPETKGMTDGRTNPYIPPTLVERAYKKDVSYI